MTISKQMMVFDYKLWADNGGDSDSDNFMRKAEVLMVYQQENGRYEPEVLADVRFEHDGRISKGHFVAMMEPV